MSTSITEALQLPGSACHGNTTVVLYIPSSAVPDAALRLREICGRGLLTARTGQHEATERHPTTDRQTTGVGDVRLHVDRRRAVRRVDVVGEIVRPASAGAAVSPAAYERDEPLATNNATRNITATTAPRTDRRADPIITLCDRRAGRPREASPDPGPAGAPWGPGQTFRRYFATARGAATAMIPTHQAIAWPRRRSTRTDGRRSGPAPRRSRSTPADAPRTTSTAPASSSPTRTRSTRTRAGRGSGTTSACAASALDADRPT